MNKYTDRAIKKILVAIGIFLVVAVFCTVVTLIASDRFVIKMVKLMAIVSTSGLILTPGALFWLLKEKKSNE